MITIPNPIKYDKTVHSRDRITEPLDPKSDLNFIRDTLSNLKRDHAEAYIVKNPNGKVMICRKNLIPAKSGHTERHQFFALKNKHGDIITAGKNRRRIESMLVILKNRIARNPKRLHLLKRNSALPIADKCKLFGYTLMKQSEPF